MDILEKLTGEKFRILRDSELKGIIGKGYLNDSIGNCSQGSYCSGSCSASNAYAPGDYYGDCYYSNIARQCVCSGAPGVWW